MENLSSEVARELDSLGHEEVLEAVSTHSREGAGGPLELTFGALLGMRRLWNFRGVHETLLNEMERRLAPKGGQIAEAPALLGRVRRLLRDDEGARAAFAQAPADDARAAGWAGELALAHKPGEAMPLLLKAAELDASWPAPLLWQGAALLAMHSWDEALRALDGFDGRRTAAGLAATPLGHLLRCQILLDSGKPRQALEQALLAVAAAPDACAGHLMAAHSHVALGEVPRAIAAYNSARVYEPEMAGFQSVLLKGRLKATWAQPEDYLRELDELLSRYPRLAALYAERAEVKRDPKLCLYQEALEDYARAAELEPATPWILAVLARAEDYSGGPAKALKTFDKALALAPRSGWTHAWRGEARRRAGDVTGARADLDRAVELMPWYSFARAWRGALLKAQEQPEAAASDLDIAIRLEPTYVFSYYERFQVRRALKDYRGAVADLNHSYAVDPKYSWLGKTRRAAAAPGEEAAMRSLDEALALAPEEPWLRAWRGYSWLQVGNLDRALEDLTEATRLSPENAQAQAWLGWAYRDSGRPDEAVAALRKAVELAPSDWFALSLLAEALVARGEPAQALEALTKVAALAPTTASVHYRKAGLELELGRNDDALRDVHKAIELDRRYADAYVLLARLHAAREESDAASAAVEKALSLPEAPATAYLIRAMIREKSGDYAGQALDFKRALELAPELFSEEQRLQVEEMLR